MNSIVPRQENGNGSGSVNGRGVRRRKLTTEARIGLATDVALGLVQITPSIKQAAAAVGVRPVDIRAEMKARAETAQVVAKTTNGTSGKVTDDTSGRVANDTSVESIFTPAMPDTPEIRVSLRRWAASLDCEIVLLEREPEAGLDFGPYVLVDAPSHHCIWMGGLPVEGIVDALRCLAHEHRLPYARIEEAWADFGKTWRR
jgi:hypothetical protein